MLLADQFVPVLFNVKRDLSEIEYLKHSTTFENVSNKEFHCNDTSFDRLYVNVDY